MPLYDVGRISVVLAAATPGVGGEPGTPAETDVYYFRVATGFYAAGALATACGITVVDHSKAPGKALTPIKELIRAGVLKSATASAKTSAGAFYNIKMLFTASQEAAVNTAIGTGLTIPATGTRNTKSAGATITGLSDGTRVTSRS